MKTGPTLAFHALNDGVACYANTKATAFGGETHWQAVPPELMDLLGGGCRALWLRFGSGACDVAVLGPHHLQPCEATRVSGEGAGDVAAEGFGGPGASECVGGVGVAAGGWVEVAWGRHGVHL